MLNVVLSALALSDAGKNFSVRGRRRDGFAAEDVAAEADADEWGDEEVEGSGTDEWVELAIKGIDKGLF